MTNRTRILVAAAFTFLVAAAGSARAETTDAEKCAAAKQKATAQKVIGELKCYATAAKKDAGLDFDCLTKADEKFAAALAKADAGECVDGGNTMIDNGVSTFLSFLLGATSAAPCGFADIFTCGGSCPLGSSCQGTFDPLIGLIACGCQ